MSLISKARHYLKILRLCLWNHRLQFAIDAMAEELRGQDISAIVSIESRGFLFAPGLLALGVKFVPARKKGKLPWDKKSITYDLEYGTDTIEMHADALSKGDRVVVVDDLLAPAAPPKQPASSSSSSGQR